MPRSWGELGFAISVAVAGAVLLILLLIVRNEAPGNSAQDPGYNSGSILHVRATKIVDGLAVVSIEVWFDEPGQRVRYVESSGDLVRYRALAIGDTVEHYYPQRGEHYREEGLVSDEGVPLVGGDVLRYRVLLSRGDLSDSIWSAAPPVGGEVRMETAEIDGIRRVVWVDKDSGLPLTEETYVRSAGETGATRVHWVYDSVEWLPLDAKHFEAIVADSVPDTTSQLTLAEAREFDRFGLYYVGDEFLGMDVDITAMIESGAKGSAIVWVVYEDDGDEARGVDIVQRPEHEFPLTRRDSTEGIQQVVAGVPARVFADWPEEDQRGGRVELLVGDTWLTIHSGSEEMALEVMESLRRLN